MAGSVASATKAGPTVSDGDKTAGLSKVGQ